MDERICHAALAWKIENSLHGEYAPLNGDERVLGLVYVGPDEFGPGSATLQLVSDGILPPASTRPEHPSDALREAGYYVGTFTAADQPRFLARLGARSAVLGEGAVDGGLSAVLEEPDKVVLAGRIPFVGDDYVAMFDARDGKVMQVRWSYKLEKNLRTSQLPQAGRWVSP
ncbi:MAG: hypothetical protein MUF27_00145 [Acidobacteria bacterium]|nr:hypothetical protein [Acidobacteriota bacterium]